MMIAANLHQLWRILRLITLKHASMVLSGNEHLLTTAPGAVGRMNLPDVPAQHPLEHAASRPCRVCL